MKIKTFPQDMSVFEVDHAQPRRCLVSGLFEETVEVNGQKRIFYTYISPDLLYNSPCLVLALSDHISVAEYLENSFWLHFAKEHHMFLHILVPQNEAWDLSGGDADYMNKVYLQINSRRFYVTMQDNIYAAGIGNGAAIAQQAVMKMSSEWSGLATFGDLDDRALLNTEATHGGEDTGKTELVISAAKVQVPAWMAWSENKGANAKVCNYWKKINQVEDEIYSNRWADEIYFPSKICKKSQVNEESISQVRVTNGFTGDVEQEFFSAVWDYISLACRHRGFGTKMLRYRIDPEKYGFTYHTMEYDGFTHSWYEYVPEQVKTSGKPVPLVVCMHGRGGTAETFISLSGMSHVAEERDFIVVFPEAGVSSQRPGGIRNLLLWDGNYGDKKIDDTGFILKMIDDVKERHLVDTTRVYACGQSSGGMMTSTLAVKYPGVFAAVAPWSALVKPEDELILPEKIEPAVPFLFLFGENDWLCVDRENGQLEYHVADNIAAFLRNLMKLYQLDEKPLRYTCGEISYYVYMNAKRVPMLTVGTVREMSHANYPRESWISYDEFLTRFSKQEDGTLLYMGEPAM
ncbi:PHB depolymerase family esterase [Roseburia hominis]